ncbi:delta-1-pyrroline-5-carboxylate dehydrogenase [Wuchereria bancrofti]|uniref:Delta-1-pyrroline-5-carboxylate dehydrogenase n=1 Tax=Wuchereria bancrofti TaxID=6293 RepID=J9ED63_WUCBA|nr:delta-1-pyrroline-5-carboxylate dehydrogenase [Wuchereria bancrofti]
MKNSQNEPVLTYQKGSTERMALEKAMSEIAGTTTNVPLVIGTEKITKNLDRKQVMPSDHQKVIARFAHATTEQIKEAIERTSRCFLHAADLCAGKYRMKLNAATMLGQGKNIVQAEIDSACELVDFFRFNAKFALELEKYQPISLKNVTNTMTFR